MKLFRCSSPDCPHSISLPEESISKEFIFLCYECVVAEEDVHFQDHSFDPNLNGSREPDGTGHVNVYKNRKKRGLFAEVSKFVDLGSNLSNRPKNEPIGFQIKKIRREERSMPDWAKSDTGVQKILLTAFPKLHEKPLQRKRAGRWAQVIQLYFRQGWTFSEVADELNEKPRSIEMVIRGITWTSKGMRADGRGPRRNQQV